MYQLNVVLLLLAAVVIGNAFTLQERNLNDFRKMTKFATGKGGLKFNGYGNWCGFGGSGKTVDDVDACCKVHDHCYDEAVSKGCNKLGPYFNGYKWDKVDGAIVCSGKNEPCESRYCACDKAAAECFSKSAYNGQNQGTVAKVVAKVF